MVTPYIDKLNAVYPNGYNIHPTSARGVKRTEKQKQRIRQAQRQALAARRSWAEGKALRLALLTGARPGRAQHPWPTAKDIRERYEGPRRLAAAV